MDNNDFSNYLIDIINKGSLSIMLSIGHRTKLFDILSILPPLTVEEIASKSKLNERYIREWLGAMVTGKIIEYDSINNKISLVKGHSWSFDGEKAWRDIKERWADENTEWVGSNYCGNNCHVTFNNNPFSYTHHEEQYITNPNVKILIDYQAQSPYNFLIAAYELKYGLGKVVSFGIFGDDVFEDNNILSFYEDIILSNI